MQIEDLPGKLAGMKQGSGVVGKLCTVAMFAFAALAVGLYSMPAQWEKAILVALGMLVIALLFGWFVNRILKYAADHPEEAAMEGSDLLKWRIRSLEQASNQQRPTIPTDNVDAPLLPQAQEDKK